MSARADGELVDRVRRRLAASGAEPTSDQVAAAIRAEWGAPVGEETVHATLQLMRADMVGAGPLEPLLSDPAVTDVLVNGAEDIWVDRGAGLVRAPVAFSSAAAVRRLAQRLASACGRRLDDAQPFVDARLPDGTRVHAVLAPVSAGTAGRAVQRLRRQRRTSRTQAAIVEAVAVLVAELRAGRHPVQSLHVAAECSSALRAAATTASWGGDVAESLRTSAGRPTGRPTGGSGDPGERTLRAVAAGWLVAERSGAGLADVLGSVESELRSEATLVAETTAELAGSQATTRVLAGLPALGVLLGSALGARPVHVLLHTPIGAACTVVGLLLEYAGVTWTARLVSGARPTGGTGG